MIEPTLVLELVAAAAVGALVAYLYMRTRVARLEVAEVALLHQSAALRDENGRLGEEVKSWRTKAGDFEAQAARLEAELNTRREHHSREVVQLGELRGQIETELKALTIDALNKSQAAFRDFASNTLEAQRKGAAADLDARKVAVDNLVTPLRTALEGYEKHLNEMERNRKSEYGSLSDELKNVVAGQIEVRQEAAKLSNALRASPKTRGRWGERTLENVLQLAGLVRDVDYRVETSIASDDQKLRPDVVVRLPGERYIVIDTQSPMTSYLDAVNAADDATRDAFLTEHARQLRNHVEQLADKEYWDRLSNTPDFVVMFVPSDVFLAAAIEKEPGLFDDAIRSRVLITTPVTLVALAKSVSYGWRQERVAKNARLIHELGRELYDRLGVMIGHAANLGKGMRNAVESYNQFVGSLESRVITQAQRFADLQVETPRPWSEVLQVESVARAPHSSDSSGADAATSMPPKDSTATPPAT